MNFAKHIKVRPEKFGTVVFDTLREKVFVTSETGGDILRLIGEGKSHDEIIERLKNVYDDGCQTLGEDITDFIASLRGNNILE